MKKLIVKIVHIKLTILVFIVLPVAVITLITSKTNILSEFKSFVVLTGSMEPNIPVGSIVYVKKAEAYKKGDVISFDQAGRTVTHRIASVDGSTYITKGDANKRVDTEPIVKNSVIGKSIFVIPYVGKIILFSKTLPGFMMLIVIPIITFMAFELWQIKKELEKQLEKKFKTKYPEPGSNYFRET